MSNEKIGASDEFKRIWEWDKVILVDLRVIKFETDTGTINNSW